VLPAFEASGPPTTVEPLPALPLGCMEGGPLGCNPGMPATGGAIIGPINTGSASVAGASPAAQPTRPIAKIKPTHARRTIDHLPASRR
jgi:hypothetical protein